jgi:hypothetical protein
MKYDVEFDEKLNEVTFVPKPTAAIKKMNGKVITIQGYKSITDDYRSAFPDSTTFLLCKYEEHEFMCGGPGLESYIAITTKEKLNLKEGVLYTFKGVFELNTKDHLALPFQLKEAECEISKPK